MTAYLKKQLLLRDSTLLASCSPSTLTSSSSSQDFDLIRVIKEKHCFITTPNTTNESETKEEDFKLPDGSILRLGSERFMSPNILFDPSLTGSDSVGVGDMVFNIIQKAEMDCRNDYYSNIVLSGGCTAIPGFKARLEHDLKQRYIAEVLQGNESRYRKDRICVKEPEQGFPMSAVFVGGCVLAEVMLQRPEFWATRVDYDECGIDFCVDKIIKA